MKAENDLTTGRTLHVIFMFSLPILFGNIFQQFYNVIDSVIVGHILGDKAFAAIGATSSITGLVLGLAYGMSNGFSIVIARYFGAKDYDRIKKAFAGSLILTLVFSAVLTLISLVAGKSLLRYLKTPDDVIDQSWQYIVIIFAGIFVMMAYNTLSGALRGIGNSKLPLLFLIVSSILNVILDLLFIAVLKFGVGGAAIATVLAQTCSVVLCIVYLVKKCSVLQLGRKDFHTGKKMLEELFLMGSSMGIMLSIVSIGSIAMQSSINGFGTNTVEAHSAARKVEEMFMVPLSTISMAVSTFASQNYGAGKYKRIKEGIWNGFLLTMVWSIISNIVIFLGGKSMVIFITGTSHQDVIHTSLKYMYINVPFFFLLSILLILRWTLQGVGHKVVPILGSMVELVGKFFVAAYLAPLLGYFGVCICEPLIWGICAIMVLADFIVWMKNLTKTAELN